MLTFDRCRTHSVTLGDLLVLYSLLRRGLFVLWGGFCVVGRLGRKKKRARPFPLPIVPRALSIFCFDGDTQRKPLRRRESTIFKYRRREDRVIRGVCPRGGRGWGKKWYDKCVCFFQYILRLFLIQKIESKFHKTLLILMKSYLLAID